VPARLFPKRSGLEPDFGHFHRKPLIAKSRTTGIIFRDANHSPRTGEVIKKSHGIGIRILAGFFPIRCRVPVSGGISRALPAGKTPVRGCIFRVCTCPLVHRLAPLPGEGDSRIREADNDGGLGNDEGMEEGCSHCTHPPFPPVLGLSCRDRNHNPRVKPGEPLHRGVLRVVRGVT